MKGRLQLMLLWVFAFSHGSVFYNLHLIVWLGEKTPQNSRRAVQGI